MPDNWADSAVLWILNFVLKALGSKEGVLEVKEQLFRFLTGLNF